MASMNDSCKIGRFVDVLNHLGPAYDDMPSKEGGHFECCAVVLAVNQNRSGLA